MGAPPSLDPNRTIIGTMPSLNATQTIKPVQCPVCKTFNPPGVIYCVDCGLIFEMSLPDDAFGAPAVQLPVLVDETGREHPLRPGATVVGREGDISVADAKVSRRHAQIENTEGRLSVEDLGSTNGTKVNGDKLIPGEKKVLNGGEKISFGGIEMQLALPGAKGGNTTQVFATNKTSAMAAPPAVEAPPAVLVGPDGEQPLKPGPNIFGRRDSNDFVVPDPYVSGKHGQVEVTDEGVYLTDLGSSNGTYVNEAKLAPNMRTLITGEDVIRLGSMEFRLKLNPKQ
jgi:pSer/pThr/pTyr-binding forkhead associated (FHA) protein